jgi:hypothetical protein
MHWLTFLAARPRLLARPESSRPEARSTVPEPEFAPFTEARAEAWRAWARHNPVLQSGFSSLAKSAGAPFGQPAGSQGEPLSLRRATG